MNRYFAHAISIAVLGLYGGMLVETVGRPPTPREVLTAGQAVLVFLNLASLVALGYFAGRESMK